MEYVAKGRDVVVTGDFNRQNLPDKLHWRQRVVAHRSVDYVIAIPNPEHKVKVLATGSIHLGLDFHRAEWARLTWEAR